MLSAMDAASTAPTQPTRRHLPWMAEMRRIEWELAEELDFTPMTPDIEFVAFVRTMSRFGYFVFGPITLDANLLEDVLVRTHARGVGGPEHPAASDSFRRFSEHTWTIVKRSGRTRTDELHMLESYMTWTEGLTGRVFGELGVSFADVQRYLGSVAGGIGVPRPAERLFSTEEAADYLAVHVQTVRSWIRAGRLPASRLAGQKSIRIRESDLQSVLEPIDPRQVDDEHLSLGGS